MTGLLLIWWSLLCAAAAFNVVAWSLSARALARGAARLPADVRATRRVLLWLSAVYVLGCGFRSLLPMIDVPRTCLHDVWIARIAVGRSVATIAELCFALQWALLLREAGRNAGSAAAALASRAVVVLIVAAEAFSWLAVLTTNYLLHAVENSLWTVAAVLAIAVLFSIRRRFGSPVRGFINAALLVGSGYVAFMTMVDVPMYLSRWQAELAAGHEALSLVDGLRTALHRCTVARDWAAWRLDVPWLTLYFTLAVWISIALPQAPALAAKGRSAVDTHRRPVRR